MAEISGSVAIITGGASGIGRATAEALARRGADVVIFDRDAERAAATARDLGQAIAVAGDVSIPEDCQRMAKAAAEIGRPVRILVNCAASFLAKGEDATASDWDLSLGVNVKGSALAASAIVPLIRQAGGGAIVNVASISGYIAQPNRWTYNATKGAILALTRCQALDLARDNIRVNSVSPGTIWTPELDRMTDGNRAAWEPVFGPQHMLNRVGEPAEVASTIVFLCSDDAGFVTGADLLVDGGYIHMGHDRPDTSIRYSEE
ncbi:MAG TPA: SDR family oxidoreductase [Chloroflexota bacterium]|nr:SDR family oxidoreductase [Chloroflexota bacterium]